MDEKTKEVIEENMAEYSEDDFVLYQDEAGWENWMNQYLPIHTSEPNETTLKAIEKIQWRIWKSVHFAEAV